MPYTTFDNNPWNESYAQDLYSYATPDEPHKPVGNGPFFEMDEHFAQSFIKLIKKKLEKTSYIPWRDKYGPGYLILPVIHPWFDEETVRIMKVAWAKCSVNDIGCFRSVRIAFPSLNKIKFYRWPSK